MALRAGVPTSHAENLAQFSTSGGSLATGAFEGWLAMTGALERRPQPEEWETMNEGSSIGSRSLGGDGGEEEDFYDCGKPGCRRSFRHDHVESAGVPLAFVAAGADGE